MVRTGQNVLRKPFPNLEIMMLLAENLKFSCGGYWFYLTERTSRGTLQSISPMYQSSCGLHKTTASPSPRERKETDEDEYFTNPSDGECARQLKELL
jgi:hypothetical protein